MHRTLVIIKPHAVQKGLTGTFLERFERMGLKIAAIRLAQESAGFWDKFYPSDEAWFRNAGTKTLKNYQDLGIDVRQRLGTDDPVRIGQMVKQWLIEHMSSAGSVAIVLEGNEAARKVRLACGSTLPNVAAPGTIRFDFSTDSPNLANEERRPVYNLIHASDPDEARGGSSSVGYEIALLFPNLDG